MDIKHALEVLNLKSNYTLEELKKSYRLHAMKHHPDKNNNSEESCENFKEVNSAYLCLYNLSVSLGSHASHVDSGDEDSTGQKVIWQFLEYLCSLYYKRCIQIFRRRMHR